MSITTRAASDVMERFRQVRRGWTHSVSARTRRHRHDAVEPRFYGLPNLFNILRNTSFLAIMACGQMLVMIVGGMDLSVGATAALASVIAAKVMASATETMGSIPASPWFSALLSALAARLRSAF